MINKLTPKNLYDIWSSEIECIKVFDFRPTDIYRRCRIPGAKTCLNNPDLLSKDFFKTYPDLSFFLIDAPKAISSVIQNDPEIENVFEISGGFEAWVNAGYPVAPLKFKNGEKTNG